MAGLVDESSGAGFEVIGWIVGGKVTASKLPRRIGALAETIYGTDRAEGGVVVFMGGAFGVLILESDGAVRIADRAVIVRGIG